jgi:hypothetical protein
MGALLFAVCAAFIGNHWTKQRQVLSAVRSLAAKRAEFTFDMRTPPSAGKSLLGIDRLVDESTTYLWLKNTWYAPSPKSLAVTQPNRLTAQDARLIARLADLESIDFVSDSQSSSLAVDDAFIEQLCNCPKLKDCFLGECLKLTNASLQRLAKCEKLERLGISSPRFTAEGLKEIVNAPSLKWLAIEGGFSSHERETVALNRLQLTVRSMSNDR